jgi:hypothetical protein
MEHLNPTLVISLAALFIAWATAVVYMFFKSRKPVKRTLKERLDALQGDIEVEKGLMSALKNEVEALETKMNGG